MQILGQHESTSTCSDQRRALQRHYSDPVRPVREAGQTGRPVKIRWTLIQEEPRQGKRKQFYGGQAT